MKNLAVFVILFLAVAGVLIFSTLVGVQKFSPMDSELLSSESKYVAEAYVKELDGLDSSSERYFWTGFEVTLNPDKDCFVDGLRTREVSLYSKDGFHWESRETKSGAVEYCVKKD